MRVNEIFLSVSGECGQFLQGSWCMFIRLAGCNLRCSWCDTARAQDSDLPGAARNMTVRQVVEEVEQARVNRVIITGGEPLLQDETLDLIEHLWENMFLVQVETNGSIVPPPLLNAEATWVVDYKLPSSGMTSRMMPLSYFKKLPEGSWVKFVIADQRDYEKARELIADFDYGGWSGCHLAFSACPPGMTHAELFRLMKADALTNVLLNVQIHKLACLKES